MKFLINREDLGSRTTGYILYNDESKEFVGYTEKQIVGLLKSGELVKGFVLSEDGKLKLDGDGFKCQNYMVRTGINHLKPLEETSTMSNLFYVVVGTGVENGKPVYEVVNSRYGRTTITESKVKSLLEFGAVQGGAYLDEKGKIQLCVMEKTAS